MTRSSTPDPVRARRWMPALPLLLFTAVALMKGGDARAFRPLLYGAWTGVGTMLAFQLTQLVALLMGRAAGAATAVTVGFGPRLADFTVGGLVVSVRRIVLPLVLVQRTPVARPGMRWQLWLAALVSSAAQIALGGWLLGLGWTGRALGWGVLFIAIFSLVAVWQPLSAGWFLLRLPFLPKAVADGLALPPDAVTAARALARGEIAEAEAALAPLTADRVPGSREYLLRAALAEARGRYEECATMSRAAIPGVVGRVNTAQAQLQLAQAFAGAAGTGELAPEVYLPQLDRAVDGARASFPLLLRHSPAPAWLALLSGERDKALALALPAARQAAGPLARAQAECAVAAALGLLGRTEEARQAVERARALCPELAQIPVVAGRIGLLAVEPVD